MMAFTTTPAIPGAIPGSIEELPEVDERLVAPGADLHRRRGAAGRALKPADRPMSPMS
jgi:hypothetical protein